MIIQISIYKGGYFMSKKETKMQIKGSKARIIVEFDWTDSAIKEQAHLLRDIVMAIKDDAVARRNERELAEENVRISEDLQSTRAKLDNSERERKNLERKLKQYRSNPSFAAENNNE